MDYANRKFGCKNFGRRTAALNGLAEAFDNTDELLNSWSTLKPGNLRGEAAGDGERERKVILEGPLGAHLQVIGPFFFHSNCSWKEERERSTPHILRNF